MKVPLLPVADRVAGRFFRANFRKTAQDEFRNLSEAIALPEFEGPRSSAEHLYAFYLAHWPVETAKEALAHERTGYVWGIEGWTTPVTSPAGPIVIRDLFNKALRRNRRQAVKTVAEALQAQAGVLKTRIFDGDVADKIADVITQVGDEEAAGLQVSHSKATGDLLEAVQGAYTRLRAALADREAIVKYQEAVRKYLKEGVPDPEKLEIAEYWDMQEEAIKAFYSGVRGSPSIRKLVDGLRPKLTETGEGGMIWLKYTGPVVLETIVRDKIGEIREAKKSIIKDVRESLEALVSWIIEELPYDKLRRVLDEHSAAAMLHVLKEVVPADAEIKLEGRQVSIHEYLKGLELGELRIFLALLMERLADIIDTFFDRNRLQILRDLARVMAKLTPTALKGVEEALRLSSKERARRLVPYLKGAKLQNIQRAPTGYEMLSRLEQEKYAERIAEAQKQEGDFKKVFMGLFQRDGPVGALLQFADRIARSNEVAAVFADRLRALWGNLTKLWGGLTETIKILRTREPEPSEMKALIKERFQEALTPAQFKKIDSLSADELKRLQDAMKRLGKA